MIEVETSKQVMSLLPLDPLLPGALPPDRRATLQPAKGWLRAAPPLDCTSLSSSNLNSTPVSTESGEGHMSPLPRERVTACHRPRHSVITTGVTSIRRETLTLTLMADILIVSPLTTIMNKRGCVPVRIPVRCER